MVRALGRLEPASGLIAVGARPGIRVEKILVAEGQDVLADEPVVILEGYDQHQRQHALAMAQQKSAEFRSRVRRDELTLERERFDRLNPTRLEGLRGLVAYLKEKLPGPDAKKTPDASSGGGLIPGQAVAREFAAGQARIALVKAELDLKELETNLDLIGRQRALEDRLAADDSPEQAVLAGQVELAKSGIEESEVRAPISGRVLSLAAHRGEVSSGPLLYLGDVATMVAKAEVFESDAIDVEVGAPATVVILGREFAGKVTRVGSIVGRNKINSLDPTALADRRVVDVTVGLDDNTLASRLVNMQVEVAIRRPAKGPGAR